MKGLSAFLAICMLVPTLVVPAFADALSYEFEAVDGGLFATPTSDETIYVGVGTSEDSNVDRSKNAAYIPPAFGSPTSYTLNSGELLTPNLVYSDGTTTGSPNSSGEIVMPSSVTTGSTSGTTVSTSSSAAVFTAVTSDLYYSGGNIGYLNIPAISLTVNVYEGTSSAALLNGAGHFSETSIWGGNVAIAGHNRGVNNHFGRIHTLSVGDRIEFTTKLGTAYYEISSVQKILATQVSVLNASSTSMITLITCVMDEPDYRWCVQAVQR